MIPGVNPRQVQQMMKQMGMSQTEIDANEVIIRTKDGKELYFSEPSIQQIKMQGQTTFQIMGNYEEREEQAQITIAQDDIDMVSEQANVDKEKAKQALEQTQGDIAQAIVNLTE